MKTKKSKSYFLLSILSITLGMSATVTIISLIYPISVFVFGYEYVGNFYGLPVRLESISSPQINEILVANIKGEIFFLKPRKLELLYSGLVPILIFGAFTFGIFLFRRVIKNVYRGNHFDPSNVKSLRIIGILIIIVPHIKAFLQNNLSSSLPQEQIIGGMKIQSVLAGYINIFNFSLLPEYIFYGLIVVILAEVFREGNILKEENELTV